MQTCLTFFVPYGSKTHLLLMIENKYKYYAKIFGGVINAAYLCKVNKTFTLKNAK